MKRPGVKLRQWGEDKEVSRIVNNGIHFPFQGDKKTWDIQVCDQKIREATEKARHETFGECCLNVCLAV